MFGACSFFATILGCPYDWVIRYYSLCLKKATFLPTFILCNFQTQNSLSHLYYSSFNSWNPRVAISPLPLKSLCFCWVPSHAGITSNECVDSLAYFATILGCHHFTKVPTYDSFHSFYLAVGNPLGLISQIINFVLLNHPSLLGQTPQE